MMLAKIPRRGIEKPRQWNAGPGRFRSSTKYSPVSLFLPFWDVSNSTQVRDVSGYHRHGTVTGSPAWVQSSLGQVMQFDGVDDYVELSGFSYGPEFTLGFWFNIPDNAGTGFKYMFSHGTLGSFNSLNVYMPEASASNPGILRTQFQDFDDLANQSVLDIAAGLADGNWHFYELSSSKVDGVRVYVDGIQGSSSSTRGGDTFEPSGNIVFGGRYDHNPDRFFGGYLGGLMILSKNLNVQESAGLYLNPWELLLSDYPSFFTGDPVAENKRRSSGCHFCLTTYPIPDAFIDASDRAQASWLYMGIAITGIGGSGRIIPEKFAFNPVGGLY